MNSDDANQVHSLADDVRRLAMDIAGRAEAVIVETRELGYAMDRIRSGDVDDRTFQRLTGTVDELEHVYRDHLQGALNTLRSLHF
ncbi:hypothetical protein [Dietzia sp. MNB45]|uniref:hypothetical protein n=1 Tax=Dietzia sp. MNB45 TaxID=3238800 RepID=UPI003F802481